MAAISTGLFGMSAACYILSLALTNNDDPYDNLPADKKPKPQKTSPSEPKEEASAPSEPSRPSKRPSEPSSRQSKPRTPSVDSKEEKTIDDLRDIQKGMGSISF